MGFGEGWLSRRSLLSELRDDTSFGVRLDGDPRGRRPVHMPAPLLLPGASASGEMSLLSGPGSLGVGFCRRLHVADSPDLRSLPELIGEGSSLFEVLGDGSSVSP